MAKNSLYSLISQVLPMVLGLLLIPHLIHELGKERFSFLSLVWTLLGYFSFLDLGIGRTITKLIAEESMSEKDINDFSFVNSAKIIVLIVSLIGTIGFYYLADKIIIHFLSVSEQFRLELIHSAQIISLGIPFVTLSSLYKGIIEGFFDFKRANIIQITNGALLFILPSIVLVLNNSMIVVCASILIARVCIFILSLFFSRISMSDFYLKNSKNKSSNDSIVKSKINNFSSKKLINNESKKFDYQQFYKVFKHGGILTVGNIISPIMASLDKFLLGGFVKLSELAFYTIPLEVIARFWIIPTGITRVFFPKFAALKKPDELNPNIRQATELISLCLLPVCSFIFGFSYELLKVWINTDFANKSSYIAKIMVVGIFFNCLNWVYCSWMQATEYIKWTIYIQIFELPFFLLSFYYLSKNYGSLGASMAWSLRLIIDLFITLFVVNKIKNSLKLEVINTLKKVLFMSILVGLYLVSDNLFYRIVIFLVSSLILIVSNKDLIKDFLLPMSEVNQQNKNAELS